jgi:hypothetical protein
LHFKDEPGWRDLAKYKKCKAISRDGSLPLAMRSFIEHLAPDYGEFRADMELLRDSYAEKVTALANHSRTPGIYGDLMLGVEKWLQFASVIGAISEEERQAYFDEAESAVSAAVIAQAPLVGTIEDTDQVEIMRFALREAIKSGKAYVSGESTDEVLMGEKTEGSRHLGWKIDPKGLYLIPDALYEVSEQMAIELSLTIPDSKGNWHEALVESMGQNNYLLSHNLRKKRKSTATRKVIKGEEKTVLHLNPKFLQWV